MVFKPVLYMLQEEVGHAQLTNLEESHKWADDPANKYKGLSFRAQLQVAEETNQNGRAYSKRALEGGLHRQKRLMKMGHLWCESGHPMTADPKRFGTILMGNSCAKIDDISWNGNVLEGDLTTLQTEVGKDLKGVLLQGVSMGFSLRGMGSVTKKNGISLVENNLRVITYDAVLNPSHKNALSSTIITESAVAEMLTASSESMQILTETLSAETGTDIILTDRSNVSYDVTENTAIICSDGSCIKLFLEDHIQEMYKNAFQSSLGV